jgi:uncharacterized membrane protein YfcA
MVVTFVVALYGGYFGAGIGILMISSLDFMGRGNARQVVALKNLLAGCLRGVTVTVLVFEGKVNLRYGPPMALGGLIGGYIGVCWLSGYTQTFYVYLLCALVSW